MNQTARIIDFKSDTRPMLLTVVHTEEEFDWSKPFDRHSKGVTHLREVERIHEIFGRHDISAIYMVDYPVASDRTAVAALNAVASAGRTTIGAHLHPWVNPPFIETVSNYNSYPGNLPFSLERAKLEQLTTRIEESFGHRPVAYLAGRYGFGERSLSVLQELGYRLDFSAVAQGDFRSDGGPDFRAYDNRCFWQGTPPILRIPHSSADFGFLCRSARRLVDVGRHAAMRWLHVPGVLSHLGAVRRVRLTPEGFSLRDLMAGTHALIAAGIRVLVFSFHSPSMAPGFTPYVRDRHDRDDFLSCIDGFLKFFREDCNGRSLLPDAVLAAASCAARLEILDCGADPQPGGLPFDRAACDQTANLFRVRGDRRR
jgi:hypothetical protein